jgi:hypothetical protein
MLAITALAAAIDSNPVHAEEALIRMEREQLAFPCDRTIGLARRASSRFCGGQANCFVSGWRRI